MAPKVLKGVALLAAAAASARGFVVETGPPELALDAPAFDAYREFGSRDGLAQSTIYSLAQDTSARVWAGKLTNVQWRPSPRSVRLPVRPSKPSSVPAFLRREIARRGAPLTSVIELLTDSRRS
jgi:hypothetical protein